MIQSKNVETRVYTPGNPGFAQPDPNETMPYKTGTFPVGKYTKGPPLSPWNQLMEYFKSNRMLFYV